MDRFLVSGQDDRLDDLCVHDPDDVLPVMMDAFFYEHVPDGIDKLVGAHGKVDMGFHALIVVMMDRSYLQV